MRRIIDVIVQCNKSSKEHIDVLQSNVSICPELCEWGTEVWTRLGKGMLSKALKDTPPSTDVLSVHITIIAEIEEFSTDDAAWDEANVFSRTESIVNRGTLERWLTSFVTNATSGVFKSPYAQ